MGETLRLLHYTFHHLVGALPQLRSFNGMGSTVYAIVVPLGSGAATLSGPALATGGTTDWPEAARAAAKVYFKHKQKSAIVVLLVVNIDGIWHCAAVHVPVSGLLGCDSLTPLSCADSVLADSDLHPGLK